MQKREQVQDTQRERINLSLPVVIQRDKKAVTIFFDRLIFFAAKNPGKAAFRRRFAGIILLSGFIYLTFYLSPTTDLSISDASIAFTRPSPLKSQESSVPAEPTIALRIVEASRASTDVLLSASPGSFV